MSESTDACRSEGCGICHALSLLPFWKRWWLRIAYGIYPLRHPAINSGAWRSKPNG
jgi:hypothetical protein